MGCDGLSVGYWAASIGFDLFNQRNCRPYCDAMVRLPIAALSVEFDQHVAGSPDSVASATGQQAANPTVSLALIVVLMSGLYYGDELRPGVPLLDAGCHTSSYGPCR